MLFKDSALSRIFSPKNSLILIVIMVSTALAIQPGSGMQMLKQPVAAPDFVLDNMDGQTYHWHRDFKGKVVLVNFWATWCPPCRAEMPSMQRAWQILRSKNIIVLAINVGEDEDAIFNFTAQNDIDFLVLLDKDAQVAESWGVRGLPTTYIIDRQGRIVYRAVGSREWDDPELLAQIESL